MLYLELALCKEDFLTEKEYKFPKFIRNVFWKVKEFFGIIVKKKIDDKNIFVVPKINKKYLKKIDNIIKINGVKSICISDELYFREDFLNYLKSKEIYLLNGNWIKQYLIINVLNYIENISQEDLLDKEIAFLVNSDYELLIEYIKYFANKVKLITIVTNNVRKLQNIEEKYFIQDGITLNIVNNYRKSLSKIDYVINFDFEEKEIKKYNIFYKAYFINFYNKYEINEKGFQGINITDIQISMPEKYLNYAELFYNFSYLNVYESFVKKRTSAKNIFKEIKKDDLEIICLENCNGMISKQRFLETSKKVLDK